MLYLNLEIVLVIRERESVAQSKKTGESGLSQWPTNQTFILKDYYKIIIIFVECPI